MPLNFRRKDSFDPTISFYSLKYWVYFLSKPYYLSFLCVFQMDKFCTVLFRSVPYLDFLVVVKGSWTSTFEDRGVAHLTKISLSSNLVWSPLSGRGKDRLRQDEHPMPVAIDSTYTVTKIRIRYM